jgi:hypothetical protein
MKIQRIIYIWVQVTVCLFSAMSHAVPAMPSDPYSDQAYQTIKDYYHLNETLPRFEVEEVTFKTEGDYQLQTVRIRVQGFPDAVLTLKMPHSFLAPLPAVVLFTGFQTGNQAVQLVGDPENVIYVGFQYPWPISYSTGSLLWDWHRMEVIPILMAVSLAWLNEQPFINSNKINVVNVSFGTLFFPLAQRILNNQGVFPRTTTFAYGGAGIDEVISHQLQGKLGPLELIATKTLIRSQTWFVDPTFHLRHLGGPFLIVKGSEDTVFPPIASQTLEKELRDPKTIITLPGSHIQPDKPELIRAFMFEVDKFLRANQAK